MVQTETLLANDSIFSLQLSADLTVGAASPKWGNSYTGSVNRIIGQNLQNLLTPSSFVRLTEVIKEMIEAAHDFAQIDICLIGLTPTEIWMDWFLFKKDETIYAVCRDITELKFARKKVELIEKNLKVGTWAVDGQTSTGHWSAETSSIHGESQPMHMDLTKCVDYFLPQYHDLIARAVENTLRTGETLSFEGQIKRADGEVRWVRSIGERNYYKGELPGIIGTIQDIEQEKSTQTKLKSSIEKFDQFLKDIPGIFFKFYMKSDGEAGFSYIGEGARKMYGYEPDAIVSQPELIFSAVHPNDIEDLQTALTNSASQMSTFLWTGRFIFDSQISWVKLISSPKQIDPGIVEWTGLYIDVTKEKESQQMIENQQKQIFTSRKFTRLGELAGGIAHEINTPLNTLSLTVDYIRQLKNTSKLSPEMLEKQLMRIESVISRVSKTVDTIRSFSRNENLKDNTICSISDIIKECISLLEDKIKSEQIHISFSDEEDVYLLCKRNQILQVLLNLVSNAIYACTKNPQEKKWIKVQWLQQGSNALIQVIDGGDGINPEIREKIFEPFYTTKPYGEGTGLGLSLASEFVKASGGLLYINSNHENTCFEIKLAATTKTASVS